MKITIEENGRPKIIGEAFPDTKIFGKRVQGSKHLFKKLDAWGIDAKYFTDVLLPNNYKIVVVDTETGIKYKTTAEAYKKNGSHFHFRPHRAQIFLPRRFWEQTESAVKLPL